MTSDEGSELHALKHDISPKPCAFIHGIIHHGNTFEKGKMKRVMIPAIGTPVDMFHDGFSLQFLSLDVKRPRVDDVSFVETGEV